MAKGVMVVDVPERCGLCQFYYPARDMHTGEYMSGCRIIQTMAIRNPKGKPDWCPIKPINEKKDVKNAVTFADLGWIEGWNACIDEILKRGGELDE